MILHIKPYLLWPKLFFSLNTIVYYISFIINVNCHYYKKLCMLCMIIGQRTSIDYLHNQPFFLFSSYVFSYVQCKRILNS